MDQFHNNRTRQSAYPHYKFPQFSLPNHRPVAAFNGYYDSSKQQQPINQVKKQQHNIYTESQEPTIQEYPKISRLSERASNPLLFKPPLVNDRQIQHMESEISHQTQLNIDEKSNDHHITAPLHSDHLEDLLNNQSTNIEETEMDKAEELDAISNSNQNNVSQNNKNETHDDWIQNEQSSIVDESSVNEELMEEFISMLEESSFIENESSTLYEESSNNKEPISSVLEESSSLQNTSIDTPSEEESSHYILEEYSSDHGPIEEPSSSMDESLPMGYSFGYSSRFSSLPIIKMPIILAKLNICVDIFDSFNVILPIAQISKLDWSVHSINCKVMLPSPNVFLKGILIANVEYIVENEEKSLHTMKLKIPWKQTIKIDWLFPPELPNSYQSEYMYKENDANNVLTHRELSQHYAEQIYYDLKDIHFVWHNELVNNNENKKLDIQGKADLSINLIQSQYVDLMGI